MTYIAAMAAIALVCAALYAAQRKRAGLAPKGAAAALVLGAALSFLLAKLFYFVLQFHYAWPRWGAGTLLRMQAATFSFFGGCVGACLGAALAAKRGGDNIALALDAFAPVLALLVACARLAEGLLGTLGAGSYVYTEALWFFPFCVTNEWGEPLLAVFMFSGVAALAVALAGFARGKAAKGALFRRTVFYLALPQIFFESLRAECMLWGFVKVEQVLCAVALAAVILPRCCKERKAAPAACFLALIGVLVGVEFALDKSGLPATPCYAVMIAALALIALIEVRTRGADA